MSYCEQTEDIIHAKWVQIHINAHARNMARKLDAIANELDGWGNPTADAIRAILESRP
jgi:hypothetical protein